MANDFKSSSPASATPPLRVTAEPDPMARLLVITTSHTAYGINKRSAGPYTTARTITASTFLSAEDRSSQACTGHPFHENGCIGRSTHRPRVSLRLIK